MISVFAVITTKAGAKDQVLAIARANLATVRAEQGCHEYRLVVDAKGVGPVQKPLGEDSFAFVEQWENLAALEAHLATPHMKAYGKAAKDLVVDTSIYVMDCADK